MQSNRNLKMLYEINKVGGSEIKKEMRAYDSNGDLKLTRWMDIPTKATDL